MQELALNPVQLFDPELTSNIIISRNIPHSDSTGNLFQRNMSGSGGNNNKEIELRYSAGILTRDGGQPMTVSLTDH
jgi:hypothetical protein